MGTERVGSAARHMTKWKVLSLKPCNAPRMCGDAAKSSERKREKQKRKRKKTRKRK